MKKTRADYKRELVQAAETAAANILIESKTGVLYPHFKTVQLLKQAWLAGHQAALLKDKKELANQKV